MFRSYDQLQAEISAWTWSSTRNRKQTTKFKISILDWTVFLPPGKNLLSWTNSTEIVPNQQHQNKQNAGYVKQEDGLWPTNQELN
jgi:hypothetical protein